MVPSRELTDMVQPATEPPQRLSSLRLVLLRSAVVVVLIQLCLTFWVAKFQLFPQVEALQISLNATLANNIARSTQRSLTWPMAAVQASVYQLGSDGAHGAPLNLAVMQQLADSHDAVESVYILDRGGKVAALVYPRAATAARMQSTVHNRLGLDLSQSEMFRSPEKHKVRISPIFLSAVSDRPMVAITGPIATGEMLVMEISLARLGQIQNAPDVVDGVQVLIVDNNGQIIADGNGVKARQSAMLPIEAMRQLEALGAGVIAVDEIPWFASSARISVGVLDWRVIVMRPEALVYQPIFNIVWISIASIAVLLGIAVILFVWITGRFSRATEKLSQDALSLERGEMPAPRRFRVKELHALDHSLRTMANSLLQREALLKQNNEVLEARVEERTQHLVHANTELGHAMEQLKQTQADLVQAGKMAALGSMVAGVAHEMNTPVGNARLAATSLVYRAQQLRLVLDSGKVSKSDINQCADDFEEGASLIDKSLERAADLVRSFKQVAVDQSSNRHRIFLLDEVIRENQVLLSPRLSKASMVLTTKMPHRLQMSGYPGDLGQVLTNLIENAMVHGYANAPSGEIFIDVDLPSPQLVRIQIRDRGCGIPESSLSRIFDPFFTSRMGQGGSGLGLAIVYKLVTQSLAGNIAVESAVGAGTTFTVELPLHTPRRSDDAV
jgi:C4-dicarboxylate-specific signal transduction histidine kinase